MLTSNIHRCARMNLVEELQLAFNSGVDLDQRDRFGRTALLYASVEKHLGIVSLLTFNEYSLR